MPTVLVPDNLNNILMALADPTRRAILTHLSSGPARVTELAAPFAISLNSVSKHIRILERADLVVRFRVGREHVLSFNPAPLALAQHWFLGQQQAWVDNLETADARLRIQEAPVDPA